MLVLARKNQQSIVVGSADGLEQLIRVTVIGIKGGSVRLGFEATSEISVHREEVWDRIQSETQQVDKKQPAERPQQRAPYLDG
jgi:carbon storage regulator